MIWCKSIPNTTKKSKIYKDLIAENKWSDIEKDILMYCEVIEEYVESAKLNIPFSFKLPDSPKSIGIYNAVVRRLNATDMLIDVDKHNYKLMKIIMFNDDETEQYNDGYTDGLSTGKEYIKRCLDKLIDNLIMFINEQCNPLEEEDLISYGTGYNDGLNAMFNYIVEAQLILEKE